jgi:hypothetical protein
VILKTALSADNHPGADLPNAFIVYAHKDFFTFACSCGEYFKLRSTNSFVSYEDIRCLDCKRKSRLKEYIGERYVFRRIKWDAKKAGRSFNLDFDWFVKQVHLPCHYCNRTDINSVTVSSKIPGEVLLANFRYNGLDRVDNAIGYEESNCVPCCVVCNRAKNSMPYNEFMDYIRGLVNHQNSVGDKNVNNEYAVHDPRVPYQGRHRKAGNDSVVKESPKDSIPVSTSQCWPNIYYGLDG